MTTLELAEKTCSRCGETKPLSEFHRLRAARDGRQAECKVCSIARVQAYEKRMRLEMGEEPYLAYKRALTAKSRRKTGNAVGRLSGAARTAALEKLRSLHSSEFERLLAMERYERGLS